MSNVVKFEKKTMTFGEDDPTVSVCRGHVNQKEFGEAQIAEGWDFEFEADHDLQHEYWLLGPTHWGRCQENHPGAKPVTCFWWQFAILTNGEAMTDKEIRKLAEKYADTIDKLDPKDDLSWHQIRAAFETGLREGLKRTSQS